MIPTMLGFFIFGGITIKIARVKDKIKSESKSESLSKIISVIVRLNVPNIIFTQ